MPLSAASTNGDNSTWVVEVRARDGNQDVFTVVAPDRAAAVGLAFEKAGEKWGVGEGLTAVKVLRLP